ncbi:hypothetical protein [Aliivibrio fischeri]|uniref:hypothetical protein n=1 Tax=Aliivibrio fischeri TaxID=668 RepID=UPI0006D1B7AA|nr:hypothetical protein [Aliivibrio fischeri]USR97971.1 hypothetical protein AVFI_16020 [Aliivibrio fischeri ATCC 7744 = JCM 18803 = DSM 507]GGK20090.1 hypothetical protein GCM10007987_00020 [Aliivibrio fischeri]
MKQYLLSAFLIFGLTGCNSENMFSGGSGGSGSVVGVSIKQTEASAHGIFVADTATAEVEVSGEGTVNYAWKVDGEVVVEGKSSYILQNKDWRKMLTVCASIDEGDETCSEELLVLPRYPVAATGSVQFAY